MFLGEGLILSVDWDVGYSYTYVHSSDAAETEENTQIVRRKSISLSDLNHIPQSSDVLECDESNPHVAVSTQQGSIIVYELSTKINDQNNQFASIDKSTKTRAVEVGNIHLSEICRISNAHTMHGEPMPAWIVAFNHHKKHTLVSGGDDCLMKMWDIRCSSSPTAVNKTHQAGVTSAQWHPNREYVFASGSYDEYLRVWDSRSLRSPVAELHTGEYYINILIIMPYVLILLISFSSGKCFQLIEVSYFHYNRILLMDI